MDYQICLVTFSIGKFRDTVICDVLPFNICHIILGRMWLWDRHVQHDTRANTCLIIKRNTKYTLTYVIDMPNLKIVKNW